MNDALNKSLIGGHEGLRLIAYNDSRGFLTVGDGLNLDAPGAAALCAACGVNYTAVRAGVALTLDQANALFAAQYAKVAAEARAAFPKLATSGGIDSFPDAAAAVICDMIFELGIAGFLAFRHTVAAFEAQDWAGAIAGIEDSKLESQVPGRVANNVALLSALANQTVA